MATWCHAPSQMLTFDDRSLFWPTDTRIPELRYVEKRARNAPPPEPNSNAEAPPFNDVHLTHTVEDLGASPYGRLEVDLEYSR